MLGSQLNANFGAAPSLALLGDQSSVASAGTNQSTATLITTVNTLITSGTAGVRLPLTPTVSANDRLLVANQTSVNQFVYPPSGGKLNNGTTNVPLMLGANKAAQFFCTDGTNYVALG